MREQRSDQADGDLQTVHAGSKAQGNHTRPQLCPLSADQMMRYHALLARYRPPICRSRATVLQHVSPLLTLYFTSACTRYHTSSISPGLPCGRILETSKAWTTPQTWPIRQRRCRNVPQAAGRLQGKYCESAVSSFTVHMCRSHLRLHG